MPFPAGGLDPGEVAVRAGLATRTSDSNTVVFAPPPAEPEARGGRKSNTVVNRSPTSPVGLDQQPTSGSETLAPSTLSTTAAPAAQPVASPPSPATGTGISAMADELYDRIELRLRRDLLLERERRGTLADW